MKRLEPKYKSGDKLYSRFDGKLILTIMCHGTNGYHYKDYEDNASYIAFSILDGDDTMYAKKESIFKKRASKWVL